MDVLDAQVLATVRGIKTPTKLSVEQLRKYLGHRAGDRKRYFYKEVEQYFDSFICVLCTGREGEREGGGGKERER